MNNTLKTLSTIITPEFQQMNLEQLAERYKKDLNPSILASAFSKVFKLIINISKSYFGFSEEDIASYSLETLDKCLQLHTSDKAAFTTYFTTIFKNRLRQESESLSTDKRKVFLYSSSLDTLLDNGFNIVDETIHVEDISIFSDVTINEKEKEYCQYLLEGYTNKEIADKLNTSIMTLSNMRKKLRLKISTNAL